jgi:hypothetical protein
MATFFGLNQILSWFERFSIGFELTTYHEIMAILKIFI